MQHGPHHLHVSELATHGLTHDHVRRRVRDGWLESLGNGSYLVVTPPTSENPAAWRRELARRRVAATLTALPGAHARSTSAALIHRLPTLHLPHRVEVARRAEIRSRRDALDCRVAWGPPPEDVGGVFTQRVAETVVEVAACHGAEAGLIVAGAALHRGLSHAQLCDALALHDRRKGGEHGARRRRSRGRPGRVAGGEPAALVVPHLRDRLGAATPDSRRDGPRLRPG